MFRYPLTALTLLLIALAAPLTAQAAQETPILQVDPGGHKALIGDIAFTPDGRYLVSASDDKGVRVWDWRAGKTVRTLRGEIGPGHAGKVFAMALSPDGRMVAVGGWFHRSDARKGSVIRLFDLATGEVLGLLKGHTNVVSSLAFSPDGRRLVSGSLDDTAIVWDVPRRRLLHRLEGHTDAIYAVAFSRDGDRVVTGSYDHTARLWRTADGKPIATLRGHEDKVRALAYSPSEDLIATGSRDHTIRLWDGRTGRFLRTLADQGTRVGSLSFSPDGRYLLSGTSGMGPHRCHVWEVATGREQVTYKGHHNIVLATAVSPDGRWAATGGGNAEEIHVWDLKTGKQEGRLAGAGGTVWAVGFSDDGGSLLWGKTWHRSSPTTRGPVKQQLPLPTPNRPLGTPGAYQGKGIRAQDHHGDWSLTARKGGSYGYDAILEVRRNGRVQATIERGCTDGYDHRSFTFTPDGQTVVSGGSNGVLTAYDLQGHTLGDFVGHTGVVWAVAVSPDGRLLASGSDDQTVRLWDIETRENLLTLFHGSPDGKGGEWVAWTPSGYYAASANGDAMVGWQTNKGPDQAAEYASAAQLKDHFYRPDLVAETIRLGSEARAIARLGGARFDLADLNRVLPPRFEVLSPADGAQVRSGQAALRLEVAEAQAPVEAIEVYVNDRLVITRGRMTVPERRDRHQRVLSVPLERGDNALKVVLRNRVGRTEKALALRYLAPGPERRGTLYLLSVGVSDYQHVDMDLRYAAADARDLHDLLVERGRKTYGGVEDILLADGAPNADGAPTRDNIEDALQVLEEATDEDTVVVFLAGHGVNEGDDYLFLPADARRRGSRFRSSSVLHWWFLRDTLENTRGQRVLMVDTCHAAGAFNPRLIKDAADARIVVLSATDSQSVAQELPHLGHGVFTHALLEGLKGQADTNRDRQVKLLELGSYLYEAMDRVTRGGQTPELGLTGFKDFVFTRM